MSSPIEIPREEAWTLVAAFFERRAAREAWAWGPNEPVWRFDLEDVLLDSNFVLLFEWLDRLFVCVERILFTLGELTCKVTARVFEKPTHAKFSTARRSARVDFSEGTESECDALLATVNGLIAGRAEYRKFRHCMGKSCWWYALLPTRTWRRLEQVAPRAVDLLFVEIDPLAGVPARLGRTPPSLSRGMAQRMDRE